MVSNSKLILAGVVLSLLLGMVAWFGLGVSAEGLVIRDGAKTDVAELPPDRPILPEPENLKPTARLHQSLAVAIVVDPTTSTTEPLLRGFQDRAAHAIHRLASQPGQGPLSVIVTPVGPAAADSRNVLMAFNLTANPSPPERRPTMERPPRLTEADVTSQCRNLFSRSRCEHQLIQQREPSRRSTNYDFPSAVVDGPGLEMINQVII